MSWTYRIVKYRDGSGFGLHEVYCDREGLPWGMTERPCGFGCYADEEPRGSIWQQLQRAIKDTVQPVFEEPENWPGKNPGDPEVKDATDGAHQK